MSAITTSSDGAYIFKALDDIAGHPVVLRAARPDEAGDALTWAEAYAPGDGYAVNVSLVLANADLMLFYGNFGEDVGLILNTISEDTNDDISPPDLGLEVINALAVNPSNSDEIIATLEAAQDLIYTSDGGDNWSTINVDPLSIAPTSIVVIWGGGGEPHRIFISGSDGADSVLLFSPNDWVYAINMAGVNLTAAANIAGIEAGYVA